jgi:hypothetical protein
MSKLYIFIFNYRFIGNLKLTFYLVRTREDGKCKRENRIRGKQKLCT